VRRKKTKGNPGEGLPAPSKSLVASKTAYKKAKQTVEAAKLAAVMEGAKPFKLYGNLLSNATRQPTATKEIIVVIVVRAQLSLQL
jgi:hypothetical protein